MGQRAAPDFVAMSETELLRAEQMLRLGEISQSDLAWLMGLEDDEEDRAPPRGFKSWGHFNAFKWHQERKRAGLPKIRRRKRAS
jgi:hypothetical protein